MLNDLHDIITARLTGMNLFAFVGTGLQDEQQKRPDALVWLEKDTEITESPSVLRDLTWGIRLSVCHSEAAGGAKTVMYNLIDAVRNGFAGWQPPGVKGIVDKSMRVPEIKIVSHESNGPTVYVASVAFRVIPTQFAKN